MSTFPSALSTISSPQATDNLNSPSHSSIESSQNNAITQLETFVGTLSSAQGTLIYDIRAAASDGGGHVQAANKGGTGQIAFTKGDVLVAQSSSVISKLAIGSNNQVLTADSNQSTGVKWAGVANATDMQNQTYTYVRASVMSGSVYGVVLAQDPSVLSDGLGLVIKFPAVPTSSAMALQVHTSSNGSVAARIKKTNLNDPETTNIAASMIGIVEFDSVSSVFQIMNPRERAGYATGQTTRSKSAGTGTQNIAHGLGVTPNLIKITAMATKMNNGSAVYDNAGMSFGTATSTSDETATAMNWNPGNAAQISVQSSGNIIYFVNEASTVAAAASLSALDSTNITLNFGTWDLIDANSDDLLIQWEAYANII